MEPIGKRVKISSDIERLKLVSLSNPLRMNANAPSVGAEELAGMGSTIMGHSSGKDFGKGKHDSALYIVNDEVPDGSIQSLRIDTDLATLLCELEGHI